MFYYFDDVMRFEDIDFHNILSGKKLYEIHLKIF